MAEPSRKPTASQYGIKYRCCGCERKLAAKEPLWFVGYPLPHLVFGRCCWARAAHG